MNKKALLLCTAAVTMALMNFNFNANAKTLVVEDGRTENVSDETYQSTSPAMEDSAIYVTNGTVTGTNITLTSDRNSTGVYVDGANSKVEVNNITITGKITTGFFVTAGGQVTINGGSINVGAIGIVASSNNNVQQPTLVTLNDVNITANIGLYSSHQNTKIIMNGGTVTGNMFAFSASTGGTIEVTGVSTVAGQIGIEISDVSSKVNLTNTKLIVENGVGIGATGNIVSGEVNLKNSEIRADILLKSSTFNENPSNFKLKTENSILEGGVQAEEHDKISFDLTNTTWYLKISNQNNGALFDLQDRSRSQISELKLKDSSIIFNEPTGDDYQTLVIGSKKSASFVEETNNATATYIAEGNAQIHLNTEWSNGEKIEDQKTDRVLINGDVSGTTIVYVKLKNDGDESKSEEEDTQENTSIPRNQKGVSLIQVSGKANENSFKLAHGYTTLNNTPYKYMLYAYGKNSSNGVADADQNLVGEGDDFWDFRLQEEYIDPHSGVQALVPQTASYLVLPNALFSAGITDMNNQNTFLSNRRSVPFYMIENKKNIFLISSYSDSLTLSSNRSALEYGYGAGMYYAALQAGLALTTLEHKNSTTLFGLLGTYGELSFTPKDMEDSDKSKLNKWSLTAYGSTQYNNGIYLDTLLSYGILNGYITNALIGNTAKLDGTKILSLSATIGKPLQTGVENLAFEPQAQLAYQHLSFDTIADIDGFDVKVGSPEQWLMLIGGRLIKTINSVEKREAFSFYSKLNLIKTFGDEGSLWIGDEFQRDSIGSFIEGGVGMSAQLSQHVSLHSDISHRHKLQKAGISGNSFSAGMRYRF
ncbi:autotransporter outer membrane beta-barrel domain-containing protein [Bartonella bacilliformis]|uniref:autotransporter outer membrane beta-barrel domain-containing protein n=1 Tax=Bartonella bacilliformis TaxID=774 RepID=UPI0004A0441D|nr:autotransporter outer membrane beta-barrel domain-containing protein [Bartonella bacilliformis]KEG22185.1 hypothetical protein H703_01010 [Bartonella bacilliformis Ver075]